MNTAGIVQAAAMALTTHYVFAWRAEQMADLLQTRLADGRYDSLDDEQLCAAMTADMQSVHPDKHLRARWRTEPVADTDDSEAHLAAWRRMLAASGDGIGRVGRLDGNVGLIDLRLVGEPEYVGPAYAAAFWLVRHTEALIVDMRGNRGGSPEGAAAFCSHFFAPQPPVHLNDVWHGTSGEVQQFWSRTDDIGARYLGRPVWLVTGAPTFSGGEDICYTLQAQGRATLVGERTRGGAHPTMSVMLTPHVELLVPNARSVNPVTGSNWEGVGVAPDLPVDEATAFSAAYTLALDQVITRLESDPAGDGQAEQLLTEARAARTEQGGG